MKTMKCTLCLLLVLVTLCSLLVMPASAASTTTYDCLSDSKYAKTYAVNTGTIIPYTSTSLSTRGTISYGASSSSYIDGYNDLLYVMDAGTNSSGQAWAKVSYPAGSKRVIAYVKLSDITTNTHSIKRVSNGKFLCALRQNGSLSSSYYVAKGDTVWLLAVSGSRAQILYPAGSMYRIAWCDKSDFENYCGSISASTPVATSDGMVDVTAYFAGKTISIQSVENGKYLCADSDASGTPLRANKDWCQVWETFTVSEMTSDGWIGIKAYTGKYFSATVSLANTPIRATADKLQSWECFRIFQKGSDFYLKAQVNGKWLCVRIDTNQAPVQSYANAASTWERLKIRVVGEEMYVSPAEIIKTASDNGISRSSNAYKALLSLNTKYASKLSSSEKQGTVVAMFEGVGNNAAADKRMNAMTLVIKNGDIVYLNRNSSTIPDYPFDPAKNDWTDMPTIKSGVYSFTTVNHRSKYAALNVTNAPVVRFSSKSSFYNSTSTGINVHRRDSNSIPASNAGWVNSAGCLLVGQSGTGTGGEYARFIQALGIVGSNASGSAKYTNKVSGKIIVDRTYAYDYLRSVGYSDAAIKQIG